MNDAAMAKQITLLYFVIIEPKTLPNGMIAKSTPNKKNTKPKIKSTVLMRNKTSWVFEKSTKNIATKAILKKIGSTEKNTSLSFSDNIFNGLPL